MCFKQIAYDRIIFLFICSQIGIIVREDTLIEQPIVYMELFVVVEELFVVEEFFCEQPPPPCIVNNYKCVPYSVESV